MINKSKLKNTTLEVKVEVIPRINAAHVKAYDPNKRCPVTFDKNTNLVTVDVSGEASSSSVPKNYQFSDGLFDADATNKDVFERFGKPAVEDALEGRNSCLLAYGQSGAGKTHTVLGKNGGITVAHDSVQDRGLVPHMSHYLFERIGQLNGPKVQITVTLVAVEIYLNHVFDVLNNHEKIKIMPTAQDLFYHNSIPIQRHVCVDAHSLIKKVATAVDRRRTAPTVNNRDSSRSHLLMFVEVTRANLDQSNKTQQSTKSVIAVGDLAGIESIVKDLNVTRKGEKALQDESIAINKSLSHLSQVLKELADKKNTYVNFRSSQLCLALSKCLGGNCKIRFVMCLSLSNPIASDQTMVFANGIKDIRMTSNVNLIDLKSASELENQERLNEDIIQQQKISNQAEVAALKEVRDKQEELIKSMKEEMTNMTEAEKLLQMEISLATQGKDDLSNQLNDKIQKIEKLERLKEEDKANYAEKVAELGQQLQEKIDEIKRVEVAVQNNQKLTQAMRDQHAAEVSKLQQQRAELETRIKREEKRAESQLELQQEIEKRVAELKITQQDLATFKEQLEKVKLMKSELEDALAQETDKHKLKNEQISALQKSLLEEAEMMKNMRANLDKITKQHEAELKDMKQTEDNLKADVERWKALSEQRGLIVHFNQVVQVDRNTTVPELVDIMTAVNNGAGDNQVTIDAFKGWHALKMIDVAVVELTISPAKSELKEVRDLINKIGELQHPHLLRYHGHSLEDLVENGNQKTGCVLRLLFEYPSSNISSLASLSQGNTAESVLIDYNTMPCNAVHQVFKLLKHLITAVHSLHAQHIVHGHIDTGSCFMIGTSNLDRTHHRLLVPYGLQAIVRAAIGGLVTASSDLILSEVHRIADIAHKLVELHRVNKDNKDAKALLESIVKCCNGISPALARSQQLSEADCFEQSTEVIRKLLQLIDTSLYTLKQQAVEERKKQAAIVAAAAVAAARAAATQSPTHSPVTSNSRGSGSGSMRGSIVLGPSGNNVLAANHFIFVTDGSRSMTMSNDLVPPEYTLIDQDNLVWYPEEIFNCRSRYGAEIAAIYCFLQSMLKLERKDDVYSLIRYDQSARIVINREPLLSDNVGESIIPATNVPIGNGSSFVAGLRAVLKLINKDQEIHEQNVDPDARPFRPIIVFLTDGGADESQDTILSEIDAIKQVKHDVRLSTVLFNTRMTEKDVELCQAMANAGGGECLTDLTSVAKLVDNLFKLSMIIRTKREGFALTREKYESELRDLIAEAVGLAKRIVPNLTYSAVEAKRRELNTAVVFALHNTRKLDAEIVQRMCDEQGNTLHPSIQLTKSVNDYIKAAEDAKTVLAEYLGN